MERDGGGETGVMYREQGFASNGLCIGLGFLFSQESNYGPT